MSQRNATGPRRYITPTDFPSSPRGAQVLPIPTFEHSHTREVTTVSVGTETLRKYLRKFLFQFLTAGHERILPRKILNTSILFRELLGQNDFCVDVFRDTLEVLTCLALYEEEYKNSDAYIKVHNLINEELRIPLDTMVSLVLEQPKPADSRLETEYFISKLHFGKNIYRLLKYYSITDDVKKSILSVLENNFFEDSTSTASEKQYCTEIKTIHQLIVDLIINSSSKHELADPIGTLSQFITHVLPSPKELLTHSPVTPKSLIIDGEYKSTELFLETHYDLLREDMIAPLRSAIKDHINCDDRAKKALFIYDEVTFQHPECDSNQGLMYRLKFNVLGVNDVSKLKWDRSERLKFGALLCIVEPIDGKAVFRDILWATVSDRNARSLQSNLTICVRFPSGFEPRVDFSRKYMMLESRQVYFESYCHTLSGLYNMREIPFTKLLLGQTLECKHPKYIRENTLFNFSPIFPDRTNPVFPSLGQWPDSSPKLDDSQYKALRLALTKEVSLIQGPPGTGKTYVGAITLEIMLETKRAYYLDLDSQLFSEQETEEISDEQRVSIPPTEDQESYMRALESPILILTYTNHALDQFLMLLLRFESKIVRIGSKVEQEELLPHCLPEIRRKFMPPRDKRDLEEKAPFLPEHIFKLKKERGQLMSKAWEIKGEIAEISGKLHQDHVTFLDITNLCSKTQVNSILKVSEDLNKRPDEVLDQWARGNYYQGVSKKNTPKQKKSTNRMPADSEYTHSASDDEDTVDDSRRYREDLNDYSGGRECIAVWDKLHQVLTDYEFNQIKSGLRDIPVSLRDVGDLLTLSTDERIKLYEYWLSFKRKLLLLMVEERSEQFSVLCAKLEKINRQIDLCILKEAAVIGMTTTGAARNSELIRQLNPRIIVVEEAAEVLEAHVIATLTPHVQHLILIGDHQQLRPSCAEYKLAQQANLEVSLFERLVKNNVEHVTLQQQHRMRPEISELISPIYPALIDHEVVKGYEVLYGVRENIFFIDHNIPEDNADSDNTTKTHKYEASYLAHLANYLVNRGYGANEITILTFYQGQKFCILDQLRRIGIRLRVSTVDKYQGEENRVVLFSVVRSNKQNNIGHCKIDNRVCVALSRAKEGLVMIGNAESLRRASKGTSSKLWNKVLDIFGPRRVNRAFPLYCHRHPQSYQDIHSPEQLEQFKDGVCKKLCEEEMDCGHKCKLLCHYINHKKVKCKEFCERINTQCGHHCVKEDGEERKLCFERCGPCNYKVIKILKECFHKKLLNCHVEPTHSLCEERCEKTGLCGHQCVMENGRDRKSCADPCGQCNYPVRKTLQCGHEKTLPCHLDPLASKCEEPCTKTRDCGHPCRGRCSDNCSDVVCNEKVTRELPCTHDIEVACSKDVSRMKCHQPCLNRLKCDHLCPLKCYENCDKSICKAHCELERECGHPCVRENQTRKFCTEDCGLCVFLVEKVIEECSHREILMCSVEPTHSVCRKPCNRILPCGHACELLCKQECDEKPCQRKVRKYCPCGHINEIECSVNSDEFSCKQDCSLPLECGHSCPLPCVEDCDNAVCNKSCERKFSCGHPCVGDAGEPKACFEDCGSCNKLVTKKLQVCRHELELPCSKNPLHSLCKKACNRKKECRHQCTGLCGQECSSVECRKEVKRELSCKHVQKVICSTPLNQIRCEQKCRKRLPCGHACNKKCYEDCTSTICQVNQTTELACGHSVTLSCHQKQNKQFPSCTEQCQKLLPCGHACNKKCYEDCTSTICQVNQTTELACGHSVTLSCHQKQNKQFPSCTEQCQKLLPCGHACNKKCYEDCTSTICQVNQTTELACGHSVTLSCHQKQNKQFPSCTEQCQKLLPCGHECTGDCGDDCLEIVCQVKIVMKLNCEHLIRFLCSNSLQVFPNNSPNEVYHITSCAKQDCERCYSIRNNYKCEHPCGKDLGCGHKCVEVCHHPVVCHPCREPCISKCVHSRCSLPCGDRCKRCELPCEWDCGHYHCTRRCWEVCNRPACNEFCPLKLVCGHACVGLCGEMCPDICYRCSPEHEVFQGDTREPILALSCGHYFPRDILDNYFERVRDCMDIPSCPKCKEPIYTTFRYGETIKRIQSKIDYEKYFKFTATLSHIKQQVNSLFASLPLVRPTSHPLYKLFDLISSKLPKYQLTKLYTIIDLLGTLAGLAHHSPEAWDPEGSYYHGKLLDSKTLVILIETPTIPDDRRNISEINSLALRCELCSVCSIVNSVSHKLSEEELLLLKNNVNPIFSKKSKLNRKECDDYLAQLNILVNKYSIQSKHLVKFVITRPQVAAETELAPISESRNSVQSLAASPCAKKPKISNSNLKGPSEKREIPHKSPISAKGEKQAIISEKTKRPAPSQPTNQPKPKLSKIEFESKKKPESERKITIRNNERRTKPSRWDDKRYN